MFNMGIEDVRLVSQVNDSDIILSEEQRNVLTLVEMGENVFFTGPAGNQLVRYEVPIGFAVLSFALIL